MNAVFKETNTFRAPAQTQFVEANDIRFAYRKMGPTNGVPLLLCNRFRGTMDEWDPLFLEALAPDRPLVLFDNAGVSSSSGEVPETVEKLADYTASFLRALEIEQTDVLGFSMGSYVCQVLALEHPELVRKLVFCGGSCPGSTQTEPPKPIFFETAIKRDWNFEDKVILFYADDPVSRRRGRQAEDRIEQQLRVGGEPKVSEEGSDRLYACIKNYTVQDSPWFDRLKEISQPTLVMNGDRDPCYPLHNQILMYEEIPNAQLCIYPMAGHGPQHQYPVFSATLINEFLG